MTEKELPTKSDLMQALNAICYHLNKLDADSLQSASVYCPVEGELCIHFNGSGVSGRYRYRPDIKAPAKFKMVLARICGLIYMRSSSGRMAKSGGLIGFDYSGTRVLMDNWYCPETGESHNWKDEWTPEEYRNDGEGESK